MAGREDRRKIARQQRLREQQMGFGTALPGSLPSLLQDLVQVMLPSSSSRQDSLSPRRSDGNDAPLAASVAQEIVLCDVGAGCGNILSDVEDSQVLGEGGEAVRARLWGVEMNMSFSRLGQAGQGKAYTIHASAVFSDINLVL